MTHLSRVVAYVPKRVDGDQTVHSAVSRKLLSLGAKLVSRFTKDLTHIVFLKKLLATQQEQGREEEILRDLFERAAKSDSPVYIVSSLWVQASDEQGEPAKEDDYLVPKPADPERSCFYALSPPKPKAALRRSNSAKRKSSVPLPDDAFDFNLDMCMYSSSQQIMQNGLKTGSAAVNFTHTQVKGVSGKRAAANAVIAAARKRHSVLPTAAGATNDLATPTPAPADDKATEDMPPPQPRKPHSDAAAQPEPELAPTPTASPYPNRTPRRTRTPAAQTPTGRTTRASATTPGATPATKQKSAKKQLDEVTDEEGAPRGSMTEPRPLRVRAGAIVPGTGGLNMPPATEQKAKKSARKSVMWAENLTPNATPTKPSAIKLGNPSHNLAEEEVGMGSALRSANQTSASVIGAAAGLVGAVTPRPASSRKRRDLPDSAATTPATAARIPAAMPISILKRAASVDDPAPATAHRGTASGSAPTSGLKGSASKAGVDSKRGSHAPASTTKGTPVTTTEVARLLLSRRQPLAVPKLADTPGAGSERSSQGASSVPSLAPTPPGTVVVPKLKSRSFDGLVSFNPSVCNTPSVIDLTSPTVVLAAAMAAQHRAFTPCDEDLPFSFGATAAGTGNRRGTRSGVSTPKLLNVQVPAAQLAEDELAGTPVLLRLGVGTQAHQDEGEQPEQAPTTTGRRRGRSAATPAPTPQPTPAPGPAPTPSRRAGLRSATPLKAVASTAERDLEEEALMEARLEAEAAAEPGPSSTALASFEPPRSTRNRGRKGAQTPAKIPTKTPAKTPAKQEDLGDSTVLNLDVAMADVGGCSAAADGGPGTVADFQVQGELAKATPKARGRTPAKGRTPGRTRATRAHPEPDKEEVQEEEQQQQQHKGQVEAQQAGLQSPPRSPPPPAAGEGGDATPGTPASPSVRVSHLPAGTPIRTPSYYTRMQHKKFDGLGFDLEELQPNCSYSVCEDGSLGMRGEPVPGTEADAAPAVDPHEVTSAAPYLAPSVPPPAVPSPARRVLRSARKAAAPAVAGQSDVCDDVAHMVQPAVGGRTPARKRQRVGETKEAGVGRSPEGPKAEAAGLSPQEALPQADVAGLGAQPALMSEEEAADRCVEEQAAAPTQQEEGNHAVRGSSVAAPTPATTRRRGRQVPSRYLSSAHAPSSSKRALQTVEQSPTRSQTSQQLRMGASMRSSQQAVSARTRLAWGSAGATGAGAGGDEAHTTITIVPQPLRAIFEAGEQSGRQPSEQTEAAGTAPRGLSPPNPGTSKRLTAGATRTAQASDKAPWLPPGPYSPPRLCSPPKVSARAVSPGRADSGAGRARRGAGSRRGGAGVMGSRGEGQVGDVHQEEVVVVCTGKGAAPLALPPPPQPTASTATAAVSDISGAVRLAGCGQPKPLKQGSLPSMFGTEQVRKRPSAAQDVSSSPVGAAASNPVHNAPKRMRTDSGAAAAAPTSSAATSHTATSALQQQQAHQGAESAGPQKFNLAYTSIEGTMILAMQGAIKRLGGARMCVEGYEEGRVTHLVMGQDRRTLKVLLAVANGAHLVSPKWVTESVAAGRWLPEDGYRMGERFGRTAAAVRAARTQQQPPSRPLEGRDVFVHCAPPPSVPATGAAVTRAAEHKKGLQRLVLALGGRVVPASACNLCIVSTGAAVPRTLAERRKAVGAVTEDWLYKLAETHVAPDMRAYDARNPAPPPAPAASAGGGKGRGQDRGPAAAVGVDE